jgi:hypothetical protein
LGIGQYTQQYYIYATFNTQKTLMSELVTFTIMLNGKPMVDDAKTEKIQINLQAGKKDLAVITLSFDMLSVGSMSSEYFRTGTDVGIFLGFDQNNNTVFSGKLVSKSIAYNSMNFTLQLCCEALQERTSVISEQASAHPFTVTLGENIVELKLESTTLVPDKNTNTKTYGSIKITGSTSFTIPGIAKLEGTNIFADSTLQITGATHVIEEGNWFTEVSIGSQ